MFKIFHLNTQRIITNEEVIGFYNLSSLDYIPSVNVITEKSLGSGFKIMIPEIRGEKVGNTSYIKDLESELSAVFGGLFNENLDNHVMCHKMLNSNEEMSKYDSDGTVIQWGKPELLYYSIFINVDSCNIQVVGEKGRFHYVSVAFILKDDELILNNTEISNSAQLRINNLLKNFFPNISYDQATDYSSNYQKNIFNTFFKYDTLELYGGLRKIYRNNNANSFEYAYCMRINVDFRK